MQTYKLQLQTSTAGLPWEYNTEFASDDMAMEYAMRVTKQFVHVPWFMYMLLWRMDVEKLVAVFKLGEPNVILTVHPEQ